MNTSRIKFNQSHCLKPYIEFKQKKDKKQKK